LILIKVMALVCAFFIGCVNVPQTMLDVAAECHEEKCEEEGR
jgi:hypothetical protein